MVVNGNFGGKMVHTNVLSTGQVLQTLGITKQTLYKWIMLRRIKAITHEIGKRVFLEFDPKEVARVKALMTKAPQKGKSLLKDAQN